METSRKVLYRVKVKLTSITTERTPTGFTVTKSRGIEAIYVRLDPDFEMTPETIGDLIELVQHEIPRQTIFWGDRDYKMWIQSCGPCQK